MDDRLMTPHSWKTAGLISLVVAVLLMIVAMLQALSYGRAAPIRLLDPGGTIGIVGRVDPAVFVRALVLAALAGVAFFTGLACFFWSAMVEGRLQRAEIIKRLAALGERD